MLGVSRTVWRRFQAALWWLPERERDNGEGASPFFFLFSVFLLPSSFFPFSRSAPGLCSQTRQFTPGEKDGDEQIARLQDLLNALPPSHLQIVKWLFQHLAKSVARASARYRWRIVLRLLNSSCSPQCCQPRLGQ